MSILDVRSHPLGSQILLDRNLEEVRDKMVDAPASAKPIFQSLLRQIQLKHNVANKPGSLSTDMYERISSLEEEIAQLKAVDRSVDQSDDPLPEILEAVSLVAEPVKTFSMGIISQTMSDMDKIFPKETDRLSWRSNTEMLKLLTIDPQARYMYLAPTPILPSLSGLYLYLIIDAKPLYILLSSHHKTPLMYSENILTYEFIMKIYQAGSSSINPAMQMMVGVALNQYRNPDTYWTFIDSKLEVRSRPVRRRPVYVEDL